MMRSCVGLASSLALAVVLLASPIRAQSPSLFTFHSAFWINLHFYLHAQSRTNQPISEPLPGGATESERERWAQAVAEYRERHGSQSLLGNRGLIVLTGQIAQAESSPSLEKLMIPAEAREVLENVAPVYRRHLWPSHDTSNRQFISRLQSMLDRHGTVIATRVASSYGTAWPAEPVRVDVVPDAGRPGNAHTTIHPTHIKIAAADPRHVGFAALEMIFHEASHAWGPLLIKDVNDSATRLGKPGPENLWHALLFFNAGYITADVLRAAGIEYEMYGDVQGVFGRLLNAARAPIGKHWPMFLSSQISRQEAIQRILQDLP